MKVKIAKKKVYDEVAQTTAYAGVKTDELEKIATQDEDATQLERFWQECCSDVCTQLRRNVAESSATEEDFDLRLLTSTAFDETLGESIQQSIFSYFVQRIIAKWLSLSGCAEAAQYAAAATDLLIDIQRKLCYKKKPQRPTYEA